jgi:hypothetical protein
MSNRPKGVTVKVFQTEPLLDLVKATLKQTYRPEVVDGADLNVDTLAYAEQPDGTPVTICSEGVGWAPDPDGTLCVPYREGFMGAWVQVAPEALAEVPTEDADLADLIRVFGSRLEANFDLWHRRLTA